MATNLYHGTPEQPYQLAAGAILVNEEGKICCHHYYPGSNGTVGDRHAYLLMRETVESGETLEEAAARGLMEEFGATATAERFLGSQIAFFERHGASIQKTTLYFLYRIQSQDLAQRVDHGDQENTSQVEWLEPDFLIETMKKQPDLFSRSDVDESEIVERAKNYL